MRIHFHHKGKYTAENISLDDVIASLSAQKVLIGSGIEFLQELDQDLHVDQIKLSIEELKSGSLSWDVLIEIYGKYQTQIQDSTVGTLEKMTGIDVPETWEPLATLAILAVTYGVARFGYERLVKSGARTSPSVHISGENNVVIQNIGEIVNQPPEVIEAALNRSLPPSKRRKLLSKVSDYLKPAKNERGSEIQIDGAPNISKDAVAEFPSDVELKSIDDSKNIDLENAKIEIRALNRDSSKTGWQAVVQNDERFPKKLPMDLYPTVNAEQLADLHFVTADLLVECDKKSDGTLTPKRLHLLSYKVDLDAKS